MHGPADWLKAFVLATIALWILAWLIGLLLRAMLGLFLMWWLRAL